MEYGRLGNPEPLGSSNRSLPTEPRATPKKSKLKLLLFLASTLMVASAISAALVVVIRSNQNSSSSAAARLKIRRPSQAISRTCSMTRYHTLCVDSLLDFPEAMAASDKDLVHISVNVTLQRFDRAIYLASNITNLLMDSHVRYEEDILTVGRKKTNIMLIGDGKGRTVISGGRNIKQGVTTFRSATFAATGDGFIARDITFENTAGPSKHQAVALRVGADHAVIFRCSIIGYQDTLYVYSQRQFYRDCDIHGTVDFIFGNAAVVFQNCNIHARKPLPLQKITVTAQNRQDPNQNTGMSFHACRLVAEPDLQSVKGSYPTYLGRPWKLYSRVVYMLSYMGDHIHPTGWLEWSSTFALDTLHYGEYMNYGPGGATGQRVKWPGFHVITSSVEASKFTVGQFIYGSAWLPSTGVSFAEGLSA